MNLHRYLEDYKTLGEFFLPDYERTNKLLLTFYAQHPFLTDELVEQLNEILHQEEIGINHYFAADVLYLYPSFPNLLFEPMLNCAIRYSDPSYCRIFLRPCMTSFGVKTVAALLAEKFSSSDVIGKMGIAKLTYWLRSKDHRDVELLHDTIISYANTCNNLVELYIYALYFRSKMINTAHIPIDPAVLMATVKEDKTYEDLLKQMKWL